MPKNDNTLHLTKRQASQINRGNRNLSGNINALMDNLNTMTHGTPRSDKIDGLSDEFKSLMTAEIADIAKKADILENAAITMKSIGFGKLYAACICGAEVVNPKIQSMVDAQELAGMSERWSKYDMQVYGPVGLDLAVSREACAHKKYNAPGAGMADILLVPNYEVGNAMGKAMSLFGGAKNAGIIVGAKVPIVLVSRSDNAETKLASIAFGVVAARG